MRRNFNAEKDAWEDQNKHLEVEANRWGVVVLCGVVLCGGVWWCGGGCLKSFGDIEIITHFHEDSEKFTNSNRQ